MEDRFINEEGEITLGGKQHRLPGGVY